MIKYFKISFLLSLSILFVDAVQAQQTAGTQSTEFSLQGAIDYALKNNANFKNAELDLEAAEYKKNETRGLGLPQISGSFDVKDYFEIPTSLLPGDYFGFPGTYLPVKFGTKYNASAGGSASQLIFSSDYIVGLKAAKEFIALSERSLQRTKTETVVSVTKAYYFAVINKERMKTLDANIVRTKKLFDDTKAMNLAGIVEKIDLDRVELTYNNLVTEKEKIERQVGVSLILLKFQMGYDIKEPITLTDELKAEQLSDLNLLTDNKINYEARPEFSLIQSQERLNRLDLKRYKYQYLPSLAAYASYIQQAQRNEFDIFDPSKKWYPIGIIGATLNVPIFSGGQKYYKVQQAKVALMKTTNSMITLKQSIDMEVNTNSIAYKNAYASMLTQKKNKELATNIYEMSKKKYEAGVGSNLEVVTAETALKEAETNYLNAIFDLLIAKIDLDKALGNIK